MKRLLSSQPTVVWAVAFAAVVSFMGLGLVDPILPAIAQSLHASPSDVELLFTSYFAFTGISMLFSSVVASRIGTKKTLLGGLLIIVIFSAAAGSSNSVGEIVGLRAGWGFGNALFIATALSVIVGAASGGVAGAVMIYEAALGFGISLGPLLGGELGGISWRGPFFGVACLMAIGFVAIATCMPKTAPAAQRISVVEPLRALRHRATRGSGLTAIFYNFGFFTLLGYAPFPLHLSIHDLGYTFTGWGLLLAVFAVFVAPRVSRRFSHTTGLGGALVGIIVVLLVMGIAHASQAALIICVICSGMFFGITNTLMTQVVMESSPVDRPIASSAYSFVRFCGGAIAPFVAGKLSEHVSTQAPFFLGAAMTAIAVGLLVFYRRSLVPIRRPAGPEDDARPELRSQPAAAAAAGRRRLVIAVAGDNAPTIAAMAVPLALAQNAEVHVLHIVERDVVGGEDTIDRESGAAAGDRLEAVIGVLRARGVDAAGEIVQATGSHADVSTRILERAAELNAATIVLGPETQHHRADQIVGQVAARAAAHVIVLHPAAGPLGRNPAQVHPEREHASAV
jgi:MFS transporter, ACDE family, multidrug resistance protein